MPQIQIKKVIHIPSNEIKHPNGYHSDMLGFTFKWKGHFLRGILPESMQQAQSYFDSGFIDEICSKGMFPKTWISEFENEEFGMIIEHEMMTPNLYSTDWNFSMLKGAALLVLDIADVAKKYGYNMIDCHKLNIMFKNSRPIYVDLGSFVSTLEGSTAWIPYLSFLHSYYNILKVWNVGAGQIAKRMMTPGIEFHDTDYHLFKNPIWRVNINALNLYLSLRNQTHAIAAISNQHVGIRTCNSSKLQKALYYTIKKIINFIKPSKSQRTLALILMRRRIASMRLKNVPKLVDDDELNQSIVDVINHYLPECREATFFDSRSCSVFKSVLNNTSIKHVISVNENELWSESVYGGVVNQQLNVSCTYYQIAEGGLLIKGRYPEMRLQTDVSICLYRKCDDSEREIYSLDWYIKERIMYSRLGVLVLFIRAKNDKLIALLSKSFSVQFVPSEFKNGGYIIIKKFSNEPK